MRGRANFALIFPAILLSKSMRHPIIQRIATSVKTFFVKKFTGIAGIGNLGVGEAVKRDLRRFCVGMITEGGGGVVSGFFNKVVGTRPCAVTLRGRRGEGEKGEREKGRKGEREKGRRGEGEKGRKEKGEGEKGRKGEREKGRRGEGEKGRKGEREKGRKGEGEKGRKEKGRKGREGEREAFSPRGATGYSLV